MKSALKISETGVKNDEIAIKNDEISYFNIIYQVREYNRLVVLPAAD